MRTHRALLAILLVASALAVNPGSASAEQGPVEVLEAPDGNVTLGLFWLLDTNGTDNLTAKLVADMLPPYYANEGFRIGVLWSAAYEYGDANRTVEVELGLGMVGAPASEREVVHEPFPGTDTDGYDGVPVFDRMALSIVVPREGDAQILAEVVTDEGQVNLSFPVSVLPARVLLHARVQSPDGNWSGPELAWTEVPVLLVNDGGAPAADLVLDFRYDGRIASTVQVPLVPPHGNHTLTVNLLLLYGTESLEVHLVNGTGAPGYLGLLHVDVDARAVLGVLSVSATPPSLETGSKVHIEALVRNRGNATSDGQGVDLMVDGSVVANESLEGLAPGDETVVSADWTLSGVGIHTVSAHAEGDDLAAVPVPVEVVAKTPAAGAVAMIAALACAATVKLAGRRSR